MSESIRIAGFRGRLRAGERMIGTFVKTPHPVVVEVLSRSALDCLCLDAEHAPFDRGDLDVALLAARACEMPSLVRVPRADAPECLNALDLGATGILIPHVTDAAAARTFAAACRYGGAGGRGYAGSTRAAGYGTGKLADNLRRANDSVAVIAQIEDAAALAQIDAIADVEDIDCLFIGRMDLTVSLGAQSPDDPQVVDAVKRIVTAARRRGRSVGMFTASTGEARQWAALGASLFLLGSDQQWMLQGARDLLAAWAD